MSARSRAFSGNRYKQARIAYERGLTCLDRLVELYPDRESELAERLVGLRASLSHARKFSGVELDAGSEIPAKEKSPGDAKPHGE